MKNLTFLEVAEITGIPEGTLRPWEMWGYIGTSAPDERGEVFTPMDVLRAAIVRTLRSRRHDKTVCDSVWRVISHYNFQGLRAAFAKDRRFIVLVGKVPIPVLMKDEDVFDNPVVDLVTAEGGYEVLCLDIQTALGRIVSAIEKLEAEQRATEPATEPATS